MDDDGAAAAASSQCFAGGVFSLRRTGQDSPVTCKCLPLSKSIKIVYNTERQTQLQQHFLCCTLAHTFFGSNVAFNDARAFGHKKAGSFVLLAAMTSFYERKAPRRKPLPVILLCGKEMRDFS